METKIYNPGLVHQVLSDMAWERMRNRYYDHFGAPLRNMNMPPRKLLTNHLSVMREILEVEKDYEELWRRVRERTA